MLSPLHGIVTFGLDASIICVQPLWHGGYGANVLALLACYGFVQVPPSLGKVLSQKGRCEQDARRRRLWLLWLLLGRDQGGAHDSEDKRKLHCFRIDLCLATKSSIESNLFVGCEMDRRISKRRTRPTFIHALKY